MHCCIVKPNYSILNTIALSILGVQIFRIFGVAYLNGTESLKSLLAIVVIRGLSQYLYEWTVWVNLFKDKCSISSIELIQLLVHTTPIMKGHRQ